ncbi:Lrp/AsnC family transcriptional regulator [Candidatus Woesearchaeota archaeon]|nr:Lrp/AsnC family transcriptional regulator [Candidatus Woesearchaeota archaeon]
MIEETPTGWVVLIPKEKKEIRLDRKDLTILQALVENARTTLPTLQKMTRLSKSSILNRINNLERSGMINGYSTLISIHKLGYRMFSIGIKTKMTVRKKEEYAQHLMKTSFVNQVITLSAGRWDFLIRVYAKDETHFDKIFTEVTSVEGITKIDVLTAEDWYFSGSPNYTGVETGITKTCKRNDPSFQKLLVAQRGKAVLSNKEFDEKDLQLLKTISNDSKISLTDIGAKIGISKDTVKYRMTNLIKNRIITCFFANINPYLLGFTGYLIILQVFDRSKLNAIINNLMSHPRCTGVLKYLESWNVGAVLIMKDITELKRFEEEFMEGLGEHIHDYEIIQVSGQPYFELFPDEMTERK